MTLMWNRKEVTTTTRMKVSHTVIYKQNYSYCMPNTCMVFMKGLGSYWRLYTKDNTGRCGVHSSTGSPY